MGRLIGQVDMGLEQNAGLIASGDSGGPAFVNGQVAGIASYTANLVVGSIVPDIDDLANSSFGEIAAWQRVSYYQQWIDQSVCAYYPNAPTKTEEVQKFIVEGVRATFYVYFYFLLQFAGVRSDPSQQMNVNFTTRERTT